VPDDAGPRVLRNRGVNAAQCGLSAQPVFGGPVYFIRNVVYNIPTGIALKFMAKPAGIFLYHNTIIAENRNSDTFSNAHFRNNLFLGTDAPNRNAGGRQYIWSAPKDGQLRDYGSALPLGVRGSMQAPANARGFTRIAGLAEATGQEKHGIELDYDAFENLRPPDPATPYAVYHASGLDFRLKPGSKAADAGVRIPNVNDEFTGSVPDLGALEIGQPAPHYGARQVRGSFYR
jgi:hypothetical protein